MVTVIQEVFDRLCGFVLALIDWWEDIGAGYALALAIGVCLGLLLNEWTAPARWTEEIVLVEECRNMANRPGGYR